MKHEQSLLAPLTEEEIRLLTEVLDNAIYANYVISIPRLEALCIKLVPLRTKLEDLLGPPDA